MDVFASTRRVVVSHDNRSKALSACELRRTCILINPEALCIGLKSNAVHTAKHYSAHFRRPVLELCFAIAVATSVVRAFRLPFPVNARGNASCRGHSACILISGLHMDKITYWVDGDPRPTCVLDLAGPGGSIYHKNGALQAQGHLVHDLHDSLEPAGFQAWALDVEHSGIITTAGRGAVYAYTIDRRWRIVQWLPSDTQPQNAQNGHCSRQSSNSELSPVPQKTDLNGKLQDALADRDNVTGRLSNLLQMMEMVDVGMFEYDREGVLVYGNDAFHRLSGVPKNETEKMAWSKWVFEEDREWLTAKWTQLTEGSSCTFDMRWIGPNAAENPEGQWVSAACVPTTDDAGNVLTVSGCITDIQAVKKRAEALERAQASEMRFSNFIKHSNVAFYNFGMDRKVSP